MDAHHIGRIVIHPRNPNIVYVAAVGHLFGANAERGVYRTMDGGQTWKKVLAGDSVTGAIDVALDPDGRTLYAAMYQRQRRGFGFVGGGTGSGLFRSRDGGDSWERLTNGLPTGIQGRIGIAIAPSQPNTVYAIMEAKGGGVFRSDDKGVNWTLNEPFMALPQRAEWGGAGNETPALSSMTIHPADSRRMAQVVPQGPGHGPAQV